MPVGSPFTIAAWADRSGFRRPGGSLPLWGHQRNGCSARLTHEPQAPKRVPRSRPQPQARCRGESSFAPTPVRPWRTHGGLRPCLRRRSSHV